MISVLFESHHLYYLSHFDHIIDELRKHGGYEISASIPKTVDIWEQEHFANAISKLDIEFVTADDERSRIETLRDRDYDVVIVGNVGKLERIVTQNSLAVMVYHGIGLKQSYYRDISPRIDVRAIESEPRLRQLEADGAANLVLTGFTKLDPLMKKSETSKKDILKKCDLSASQPTILYAPSFYPSSLEKLLPELPAMSNKVNFIIKLHDFSWHQNRYEYQSREAEQIAYGSENTYLVPPEEYNILPYYMVADILISDVSSTLFEYLALNRPIVQTEFYSLRLKHRVFRRRFARRLDHVRANEIDFTLRLTRPADLHRCLEDALQNPQKLSKKRTQAARHFLYRLDGRASERLIEAIESKLKLQGKL